MAKEQLDPFARRKKSKYQPEVGTVTTVADNSFSVGTSSDIDDTMDDERKNIASFIPQPAQSKEAIDEGLQKMMNILHQQELDDVRDGVVKPAVHPKTPESMVEETSNDAITTHTSKEYPKEVSKDEPLFTDEELLPILDSILHKSYASETFIMRGMKVTIRTQFFWEDLAVREATDKRIGPDTLRATAEMILQRYALASSIERIGDNYFPPLQKGSADELQASLEERLEFLDSLPNLVVWYINKKRGEFNDKVVFISENMDRLIKAF